MWCSTCQQDVPRLGVPTTGALRCAKCGGLFPGETPPPVGVASDSPELPSPLRATALLESDWALEAELRGVQRLVGAFPGGSKLARQPLAIDTPHAVAAGWHAKAVQRQPAEREAAGVIRRPGESPRSLAAWSILSLSLAVFVCGAVLLGWSLAAKRADLWPVGMPLALIGEAGLILGLILQLDTLWQSTRQTAEVLHELDGELKQVRQATTLLTTSRGNGAQTFYAHLAEGASPQMLLADLKGQLDLVAQQMGKR
jgi:hypothetical protein